MWAKEMSQGIGGEESQAEGAASNRESPLHDRALAPQNSAQHHHPTLPSILLVKREQVGGSQQEIHHAEASSKSEGGGDQVDVDAGEQYQNLLAQWSPL